MGEPRRLLWVPVRESAAGTVSPLLGRLPGGPRTGLAFTSITALGEGCRPGQPWIHLSEPALQALLGPLGITRIQLDPVLIVAVRAGRTRVLIRRETDQDLLHRDVG